MNHRDEGEGKKEHPSPLNIDFLEEMESKRSLRGTLAGERRVKKAFKVWWKKGDGVE